MLCRVICFDFVSEHMTFLTSLLPGPYMGHLRYKKSGINYPVGEQWKGHYVYAAVNGTWTMCQVFTVQKNQWEQCIMQ